MRYKAVPEQGVNVSRKGCQCNPRGVNVSLSFNLFGFVGTAESCFNIDVTIQCCENQNDQIC